MPGSSAAGPGGRAAPVAGIVRVRVPEPGLRQDLRAVKIVLHRELLRFWRDKLRMVSGWCSRCCGCWSWAPACPT